MMRLKRFLLACALLASWPATGFAEEKSEIETFSLKNGMRAIVIPNHRVPAVSHMLWFNTGAIDDPQFKSGLTHYHEHMMFQGTQHYKKGEYADIVARHGGQQNAFTGHDATGYYINIAKENLPLAMELEADRLRGLAPTDADALKEREVIIEERRSRIENDPQALFNEQMAATLFLHHPYRIPVIGWMHEMEGLTKDDVLKFHKDHYHPGNALLVVSGDITAAELKPLAEKYYGGIPTGPKHTREWNTEPPQRGPRRFSMTHPNVQQPYFMRTYATSGINGAKKELVPALCVLEHVLGGGTSSRLYQSLVVKSKVAAGASASYDGFTLGPARFSVSATPTRDGKLEDIEKLIDAELLKATKEEISEDELKRAKILLKAEIIYAREGLQSMAYILGWLSAAGLGPEFYHAWPDMIDKVTAADVRKAAQLLDLNYSVTGTLLPEGGAAPAPKEADDAKL